jgi:hypothetical protein
MAQLPLEAGARNARERFDTKVNLLQGEDLGEKLEEHSLDQVRALLILLGALFGVSYEEMAGVEHGGTAVHRRGLASMLAACWAPRPAGRGFRPSAIVAGIKRAADFCQAMPTEGLLAELIRGAEPRNYPGGLLQGQEVERPERGDGQIAGAQLATDFELESERLGLQPDQATPDDVALERSALCRELMGSGWGVLSKTPQAEIERKREAYREAARAEAKPETPQPDTDECPF